VHVTSHIHPRIHPITGAGSRHKNPLLQTLWHQGPQLAEPSAILPYIALARTGFGCLWLCLVLQVFAVDAVAARRQKAAQFGAIASDLPEAAAALAAATGGRGADIALELVGSNAALQLGFELLRPAGVLSSIGVHTAPQFPFSPVDAYDKNLTVKCGRCPARHYMEKLLPLVQQKQWPFTDIITHTLPLSQGVEAYHMFDKKLDGCIKVVLDPWA